MPKFYRRKPKNANKHMKVTKRSYVPKSIRYVDEFHTKMSMNSNGDYAYALATPPLGQFNSVAMTFKLANLINIGVYQRLFEEVRVNKVHISFRPLTDNINATPWQPSGATQVPIGNEVPLVYYLIDRNDEQAEASADDFKEYSKTVMKPATKPHQITFTPSTLSPVYKGPDPTTGDPTFSFAVDYQKKWLQLTNAGTIDTTFFGLKFGIEGSNRQLFTMIPTVTMYVSFRGKRE